MIACSLAQAGDPRITVGYTRFRLPNGLDVILHEDHTVPAVSVKPLVPCRIGAREARTHRVRAPFRAPDVHGFEKRPRGKTRPVARAAGGDNNATTSTERTNYYENIPSNALDLRSFSNPTGWDISLMP